DPRKNQGPEALRIASDDQESHLPGQSHAEEPVVKLGMSDGGRHSLRQGAFSEKTRRQHHHPVNARHKKNHARETLSGHEGSRFEFEFASPSLGAKGYHSGF